MRHVARVKIPNYLVKANGQGYWQPRAYMRAAGFNAVACGPDGPEAWKKAAECVARWKEYVATEKKRRSCLARRRARLPRHSSFIAGPSSGRRRPSGPARNGSAHGRASGRSSAMSARHRHA